MEAKLAQIDALTQRCTQLEAVAKHNEASDLILRDMINKGQAVMDEAGNVNVVVPQHDDSQMQADQVAQQDGSSLIGQGLE